MDTASYSNEFRKSCETCKKSEQNPLTEGNSLEDTTWWIRCKDKKQPDNVFVGCKDWEDPLFDFAM